MEFDKLQYVPNGIRIFDTDTSTTKFYQWVEDNAVYFATGLAPTIPLIKFINDSVHIMNTLHVESVAEFRSGSSSVYFAGPSVYFSGLSYKETTAPTNFMTTDIIGEVKKYSITNLLAYIADNVTFSNMPTTIASPYYSGNIAAVDSLGKLSKLSSASLPYVTLNTTQTITGTKLYSSILAVEGTSSVPAIFALYGYCGFYISSTVIPDLATAPAPISGRKLLAWSPGDSKVYSTDLYSLPYLTLNTSQTAGGDKTFNGYITLSSQTTMESTVFMTGLTTDYSPSYFLGLDYNASRVYKYEATKFARLDTTNTFTNYTLFNYTTRFSDVVSANKDVYWGQNSTQPGRLWNDGDIELSYSLTHTLSDPPNVFITAQGFLRKSTASSSTRKIKKDIEDLTDEYASKLHLLRPIWSRYSIKLDTPDEWGWFSFVAEEVAEVLPQLAVLSPTEDSWTTGEDGKAILKEGFKREPSGVRYDRITVLLTHEVQKLRKENDDLLKRIEKIEKLLLKEKP